MVWTLLPGKFMSKDCAKSNAITKTGQNIRLKRFNVSFDALEWSIIRIEGNNLPNR